MNERSRVAPASRPGDSGFDLGPWPHLGYTGSRLGRAAERRMDTAFLAEPETQRGSGTYAIAGELVILRKAADGAFDPLFRPAEARALAASAESVFLGLLDGDARFGLAIVPAAVDALKARPDLQLIDLRSIAVQGLVAPEHLPPLAEAKAMLHWHARHRFCANCGVPTAVACAGWKRECPGCKAEHFPRTDPVVIMLAIDGDRCLLGRQARFPTGTYSCLAGFVEPGETMEEAARREIHEEAGVICGPVKYFATQPWPFPMSLMMGCHARALSTDIVVDREELEEARWFTRDECALMLMRRHPDGLVTPPPVAIAHHIIRAWVEGGEDVLR
ncbi:MAG TPA: NAD(+) diphosphatase [Xanthobacteraceae bacterium]